MLSLAWARANRSHHSLNIHHGFRRASAAQASHGGPGNCNCTMSNVGPALHFAGRRSAKACALATGRPAIELESRSGSPCQSGIQIDRGARSRRTATSEVSTVLSKTWEEDGNARSPVDGNSINPSGLEYPARRSDEGQGHTCTCIPEEGEGDSFLRWERVTQQQSPSKHLADVDLSLELLWPTHEDERVRRSVCTLIAPSVVTVWLHDRPLRKAAGCFREAASIGCLPS